MPEMPEVETMVERLQKWVGYQIVSATATDKRYLPEGDDVFVVGQKINGIFRRGKFIVFMLDHGALLCHNAMSGYWDDTDDPWTFAYVEGKREATESDVRAQLMVQKPSIDKNQVVWSGRPYGLRFHDTRKFGSLRYVLPDELAKKFSELGPEVLDSENLYEPTEIASIDTFWRAINSDRPIKASLMEQKGIAGIGNIYASEALWKARISPLRSGSTLNDQEQVNLFEAAKSVLQSALDRRLDYDGLKIYRRQKCPDCGGITAKQSVRGRSTYWCPECQR